MARTPRSRHVRHRRFDGVERGVLGAEGRSRLPRMRAFLAERSTAMDGSDTPKAPSSVDAPSDVLTFAATHGYDDGDVVEVAGAGTPPEPLTKVDPYVVDSTGSTTLLLQSRFDRQRGAVDVRDAGTPPFTLQLATSISGLVEWMRVGRKPVQVLDAGNSISNL